MTKLYLSERQTNFKSNTSLLDDPVTFETQRVNGCVFYLPQEGAAGGDSFIVRTDQYLTISLLADMTGHGAYAREALLPLLGDFENLASLSSSSTLNQKAIRQTIADLDERVGPEHAFALSIIRLTNNRTLRYVNIGENKLILLKKRRASYHNIKSTKGKIGWLYLSLERSEDVIKHIAIHNNHLARGDRLLLYTDGVFEYMQDPGVEQRRHDKIGRALITSTSLAECIKRVNLTAFSELQSAGQSLPPDDYTIIGLEMR